MNAKGIIQHQEDTHKVPNVSLLDSRLVIEMYFASSADNYDAGVNMLLFYDNRQIKYKISEF